MINWARIKADFAYPPPELNRLPTLKDLAKKYNVSLRWLEQKSSKDGWIKQRKNYLQKQDSAYKEVADYAIQKNCDHLKRSMENIFTDQLHLLNLFETKVGKQLKEMVDKVVAGKIGEAAAIHRRLLPLVNAMFVVSNPIPVKYALNHVGFRVGKTRLPLTEPDEKSAALIRDTLKNYKIDLPV